MLLFFKFSTLDKNVLNYKTHITFAMFAIAFTKKPSCLVE